jgi:predicted tellurium resistance membrane protein TerC
LHLKFVFEYMFGISIAIIFPMVLLVIYTTRLSITKVIVRLEKRIVNWKWFHKIRWERQKKDMKKRWEENDGDYASSSGVAEEKEQAKKRVPFWRRQVVKETVIVDAEKGVNGKSGG